LAEEQVAVIVLASASPRRAELLASAGLPFVVVPSSVVEERLPDEPPGAFVRRLAAAKARDVAAARPDGRSSGAGRPAPGNHETNATREFVLAADTDVVLDGDVLGKPRDEDDARAMLARLSGRVHDVVTGYEVYDVAARRADGAVVRTRVEFAALSRGEIDAYVATGEPMGKAGGYAIQGRAAGMVRRIEGSYTNVVGLPLREVLETLARMGAL
jgi:nucleoside triphosphate pyrophosphatase